MSRLRAIAARPSAVVSLFRRQYGNARDLGRQLSLDVSASAEVQQATLRALNEIDARLRVTEQIVGERVTEALAERPDLADGMFRRLIGAPITDLTPGASELLAIEYGYTGFRAQAGLWINPPLVVSYAEQRVYLHEVNERIVEIPYALGVAQGLDAGSRIVDVGASESTVALSLASLGFDVTALDVRGYPFTHPRLAAVAADLFEWDPSDTFDAAVCVSTLEHVGIGWYGDSASRADADRDALGRIGGWLRPGGRLVLTVPFGDEQAADHQRTYDRDSLDKLLDAWEIEDLRVLVRDSEGHWLAFEGRASTGIGVALVTARRPLP